VGKALGEELGAMDGFFEGTSDSGSSSAGMENIPKSCSGVLILKFVSSRPSKSSKSGALGIDILILDSYTLSIGDAVGENVRPFVGIAVLGLVVSMAFVVVPVVVNTVVV